MGLWQLGVMCGSAMASEAGRGSRRHRSQIESTLCAWQRYMSFYFKPHEILPQSKARTGLCLADAAPCLNATHASGCTTPPRRLSFSRGLVQRPDFFLRHWNLALTGDAKVC